MQPNPVLSRLGFAPDDRVVIVHCDDIGMCQASVAAFSRLYPVGIVSSGAVMVPCSWFPAAMQLTVGNPEIDLGVHLTFTSEWESYRWGPISTREQASGMLDGGGYFYRTSLQAQENIDAAFAYLEMEAQIKRMIQADFRPSHIDTHMGTVAHPKFMQAYIELALKYRLPLMMFRLDEAGWKSTGMDSETASVAAHLVKTLESLGVPLLDQMASMPLDHSENRMETARALFTNLPKGLTHFILHPSIDSPEIRFIAADWQARVADYQTFCEQGLQEFLNDEGIHIIGYRQLQELMPDLSGENS